MKNLTYHKKFVKQRQAEKRFQEWANSELAAISTRVMANSNKRWDAMQHDLELQRCKLDESINAHPSTPARRKAETLMKMMNRLMPVGII